MSVKQVSVDQYMADLAHPRHDEILRIREAILAADPAITETVKWNAPNFRYAGDDRVTLRLQPGDRVQLVLHRGVGKKPADGFRFDDPTGLITWADVDRGTITIAPGTDLATGLADVVDLVTRWMCETSLGCDHPCGS